MAERGKFWTAAETKLLIDTWSQDSIQKQLHGAKRNDNVFAQIVNTLAKRGYHRTAQQCRAKIKTLKKRYKECSNSALLLLERLFLRIPSHKIAKYANIHIVVAEMAIFVSLSDIMYYVID